MMVMPRNIYIPFLSKWDFLSSRDFMQQQEQKKRWHFFFLRDSSSEEGRDLAKAPKGMMSTLCRVINGSPDRENKLQHEETVMYHHQCWEGITGNITSSENPCPSLFSRGDYMRCIFLLFLVSFLVPYSSLISFLTISPPLQTDYTHFDTRKRDSPASSATHHEPHNFKQGIYMCICV